MVKSELAELEHVSCDIHNVFFVTKEQTNKKKSLDYVRLTSA